MFKFQPILRNRLPLFRTIFISVNKTDFYRNLGGKHVVTVPWAYDPEFNRVLNLKKTYTVSFIGTDYKERKRVIKKIENVATFSDFWRSGNNTYP
ncbi:MAG: hypothetical protein QXU18_09645 [Thermoplasmatales archaeon]